MTFKFAITLAAILFCTAATARDIYVSPTGNDKLNGAGPTPNLWKKTGPYRTLARAQQAIRDIKADGKFTEAITVHVGKGTFQLQSALEFDDRDSGFPDQRITWEGEIGESIISGGISLNCTSFDPANPLQVLNCKVSNQIIGNIKNEKNSRITAKSPRLGLFVSENRMQLARWPHNDWAHIRLPIEEKTRFSVFEKMPIFSGELSNAQVHIFANNDYYDQYIDVENIESTKNQISLHTEAYKKLASGRRFYLENIESALNTPGEWIYDKKLDRIRLIPPKDVAPDKVIISYAFNLLKINSASNLEFRNLAFQYSSSSAIQIDNSNELYFERLKISHVDGKCIQATNSNYISVSKSHLYDAGLGGISIGGGNRQNLDPSGNLVYNNYIHDFDKILYNYSPAVLIDGVATAVLNNLISDSNGNAIVINGNDHLVEKNEITNVCRQSGDCAAIYSGRDWTYRGNKILYNNIHDFSGYQLNASTLDIIKNTIEYINDGARGIYLDDGVSGFTVYGNILVNAGSMALQLGGGRDTLIENNIIIADKYAIWIDNRFSLNFDWQKNIDSLKTMPINSDVWQNKYPIFRSEMNNQTWPEGNTILRNIIISTHWAGRSIRYIFPKQSSTIANNLVWNKNGDIRVNYDILDTGDSKTVVVWKDWLNVGIEKNSYNEDPCINVSGAKIILTCTNSPINKIGFKSLPSNIGLIE